MRTMAFDINAILQGPRKGKDKTMNEVTVFGFSELQQMAATMAKSGMFGKTPDQMLSLMMIAQAESLHPALAAMEYDIIQGRPALKGQAALARFQQAGGRIDWITRTDTEAKAKFTHPQGGELVVSWDATKAKKAGLWDKRGKDGQETPWQKMPGVMLSWRVVAEGVRAIYPACLNRMYLAEEVQDFEPLKNVTPAPEDVVKSVAIEAAAPAPAVDWIKLAAKLTVGAGLSGKEKTAIYKECGCDPEAYCRRLEDMIAAQTAPADIAPDDPNGAPAGDDFQLTGAPPVTVEDLITSLEQYAASDATPEAARNEIKAYLESGHIDIAKMTALLEKAKGAKK